MPQPKIFDKDFDSRLRTLHLLPILQIDPFDRVTRDNISLSVSLSWLEGTIEPTGGWGIHQPYPNGMFFVGGGSDCHLGHFITLPEGQQAGEVVFRWNVASSTGKFQITHRLELTFEAGQGGRTYSMDIANWWALSPYAEEHRDPEIGRNRVSRLKSLGISPSRRASVDESVRDGCRHIVIREMLSLPAITLNDCWSIDAYGGAGARKFVEALG